MSSPESEIGFTESFWYGDQYIVERSLAGMSRRTRHTADNVNVVHRRRGIFQNATSIRPAKTRSHATGGVSAKHKAVKSTMPARPATTFTLYARMPAPAFSSSQPTSCPNGIKQKTNKAKTGTVSRIAAIIIGQLAGIDGMPQI